MASNVLSLILLILLGSVATAAATGPVNITGSHNITKVLDQFPNFSTLNRLLSQTKVADKINSRQSITLLAVADSAISSVAGLPADVQEKVLSVHVVLDYYDLNKITNLHNATALLTTLFQASGNAAGQAGFLNATDVGDGQVKLGSAAAAANGALTSDVIREIAMQPYNLSVIEISQPIVPPGIASSPSGAPAPPKVAPASPPKASASSPSPSASSSAPTTAKAPVSKPPTPSPTAPSADAPASSADTPDASADTPAAADDKKASSASRRFVAGAGIGAAMGAAFFLVAP